MKKLASILYQLMTEQDITASELARRAGIGQPVIHRLLSGVTLDPKISTLSAIAPYFAISISQLIGEEPLPKNRHIDHKLALKIPLLQWEHVRTWPNNKSVFTELDYCLTDALISTNSYGLIVKDTTMQPLFNENMLLIIDPNLFAKDLDYVIVYLAKSQQILLRQLFMDGQQAYVKPLNVHFKMLSLGERDQVLGVVVQTKADYR